jgi:hypothetical protein
LEFRISPSDQCLFIKDIYGHQPLLIATYVDDVLIASQSEQFVTKVESQLAKKLKLKILGDVRHILGWKIDTKQDGSLTINQEQYTLQALLKYNMSNCNPCSIPAIKNQQHSEAEQSESHFPYREAIGTLLYLANCTRPDICQAVHFLARFCQSPSSSHITAVKRFL